MATKNNNLKANTALAVSLLGFIFSYPFHHSFAGGLISSGFSAGLIGGLADWFAVNSLFRRPLGVPPGVLFRTEIIPRNREKIIDALIDMVQNELLSPETVRSQLEKYNFAEILLNYWHEQGGKTELVKLLSEISGKLSEEFPLPEAEKVVRGFLNDTAKNGDLHRVMEHIIMTAQKTGFDKQFAGFIGRELQRLSDMPQIKMILTQLIEGALNSYEKHNGMRKIFGMLVRQMLTPEKIQAGLIHYLRDEVINEYLNGWLRQLSDRSNQPDYREKLGKFLCSVADDITYAFEDTLVSWLKKQMNQLPQENSMLMTQIDRYTDQLQKDPVQMNDLDRWLKNKVFSLADDVHAKVGTLIHEALQGYSNEQIVEMIESKAGNDLQMIRINGSIVGSLVGICLYLIVTAIGS